MYNQNQSRRDFLKNSSKSAAALVIMAPLVGSELLTYASAATPPMEPIALDLTKPENAALTKIGGSQKVAIPGNKKIKPIIVVRKSETEVVAFSSKCPHLGCEVKLPEGNSIKCPCHGSIFDIDGKVTHGPARSNLAPYMATLAGSVITIRPSA
jgi:Rieske Fe-S protein